MDKETELQFVQNKEDHQNFMADIKQIKDDINEIKILIAKLPEKLDERYASKVVEKGLWWTIGVLFVNVIGLIFYFIQNGIANK